MTKYQSIDEEGPPNENGPNEKVDERESSSILFLVSLAVVGIGAFIIATWQPMAKPYMSDTLLIENYENWKEKRDDIQILGSSHEEYDLVYLNHSEAFKTLAKNPKYSEDYFLLQQGLDAQENQAYCPVATLVAVLNSFRKAIDLPVDPIYAPYPYATQQNLWNDCTANNVIRHDGKVDGIFLAPGGLGMPQTKALLECNLPENFFVEMHHLDPKVISIDQMRHDLKTALTSPNSRVIVNYHRKVAQQIGGGHWSPIGSYDEKRDAFLVMDVAKYKYPPAWIPTDLLYQSLSTLDSCGIWDFPFAQDQLAPNLRKPRTEQAYIEAQKELGCSASPRGYILIHQLDEMK